MTVLDWLPTLSIAAVVGFIAICWRTRIVRDRRSLASNAARDALRSNSKRDLEDCLALHGNWMSERLVRHVESRIAEAISKEDV